MLGENVSEDIKRILAEPQHAQKMQRLLNARHELRNARISSILLFACAAGLIFIQSFRYTEKGQIDAVGAVCAALMSASFLLSLARLKRSSAAYYAEQRPAA